MKTLKRNAGRDGNQPYLLCVDEQALHGSSFEPSLSLKLSQYSAQPLKHKGFDRPLQNGKKPLQNVKQALKSQKMITNEMTELVEDKPRSKSQKMRPEEMGLKKKHIQSNRRKVQLADSKSPKSKHPKRPKLDSSVSASLLDVESQNQLLNRPQKPLQVLNESLEQRYLQLLHKYKSLRTRALQEETTGKKNERQEMHKVQLLQEELKLALDEQKKLGQKVLEIEQQWKEERKKAIDDGKEKLKQKEMEYKNQELGLRLRLQEVQSELNIMLHRSSLSNPLQQYPRLEVVPTVSSPPKLESFYSRRESRPTDAIKSGISKSVAQPQPRWMNSETLTASYLPMQHSQNPGSLQKASVGTKSVKRTSTISQAQNPQKAFSVAAIKVNPVQQLEKVLEQVATDYKKIQHDNKIVKQKLENIQSAILR